MHSKFGAEAVELLKQSLKQPPKLQQLWHSRLLLPSPIHLDHNPFSAMSSRRMPPFPPTTLHGSYTACQLPLPRCHGPPPCAFAVAPWLHALTSVRLAICSHASSLTHACNSLATRARHELHWKLACAPLANLSASNTAASLQSSPFCALMTPSLPLPCGGCCGRLGDYY